MRRLPNVVSRARIFDFNKRRTLKPVLTFRITANFVVIDVSSFFRLHAEVCMKVKVKSSFNKYITPIAIRTTLIKSTTY